MRQQCTLNASTLEAETGEYGVHGQPGLHGKTLSQRLAVVRGGRDIFFSDIVTVKCHAPVKLLHTHAPVSNPNYTH